MRYKTLLIFILFFTSMQGMKTKPSPKLMFMPNEKTIKRKLAGHMLRKFLAFTCLPHLLSGKVYHPLTVSTLIELELKDYQSYSALEPNPIAITDVTIEKLRTTLEKKLFREYPGYHKEILKLRTQETSSSPATEQTSNNSDESIFNKRRKTDTNNPFDAL